MTTGAPGMPIVSQPLQRFLDRVRFSNDIADVAAGVRPFIDDKGSTLSAIAEARKQTDEIAKQLKWNGGGYLVQVRVQRNTMSMQSSILGPPILIGRDISPVGALANYYSRSKWNDDPQVGVANVREPDSDFFLWFRLNPKKSGGELELEQGVIPKPFSNTLKSDANATFNDENLFRSMAFWRKSRSLTATLDQLRRIAQNARTTAQLKTIESNIRDTEAKFADLTEKLRIALIEAERSAAAQKRIEGLKNILSFSMLALQLTVEFGSTEDAKALENAKETSDLETFIRERTLHYNGLEVTYKQELIITGGKRDEALRQLDAEIRKQAPGEAPYVEILQP